MRVLLRLTSHTGVKKFFMSIVTFLAVSIPGYGADVIVSDSGTVVLTPDASYSICVTNCSPPPTEYTGPAITCAGGPCPLEILQGSNTNPITASLEAEARQKIAALRGISDDFVNLYWSRGEIRAYMFLRLLQMANAPAGSLSDQEQAVVDYFTKLINDRRILVAQTAVDLYQQWNSNPCSFHIPVGDPNAYINKWQYLCGSQVGSFVAYPDVPSADEFRAWAEGLVRKNERTKWTDAYMSKVYSTVEQAQQAVSFEYDLVFGGITEGEAFLNAMHAKSGIDSTAVLPAEADLTSAWYEALHSYASDQLRDWTINALTTVASALDPTLAIATAESIQISIQLEESLIGVVSETFDTYIGPAIFVSAVLAFESWKFANYVQVPDKLNAALAEATAGHSLYEYANDTNANGSNLILNAIVQSSLPDFFQLRLWDTNYGAAPAPGPAQPSDPLFLTDTASSAASTFSSVDWEGNAVTTSVRNGWFVQQMPSQALRYTPSLNYFNDKNERWRAWLHDSKFLAERVSAYAGLGRVTTGTNYCGDNVLLYPTGNVALGNVCVYLGDYATTFYFPLVAGQSVEINGQVRKIAYVNNDSAGNTTSFAVTAAFAEPLNNTPVFVLAQPVDDCFANSTISSNSSPDCIESDTINFRTLRPYGCTKFNADCTTIGSLQGNPYQNTVTMLGQPLTITAPSLSVTYGDPTPTVLTPTYAGEPESSLAQLPTCSTTYTAGSPAGTYPIICSGAVAPTTSTNIPRYVIYYSQGQLTVNQKAIVVTPPDGSMTYGSIPPVLEPVYSGFLAGEGVADLGYLATCSTEATSTSAVGSYNVNCTVPLLVYIPGNYWLQLSNQIGLFQVNPAPLNITASSGSMILGGTPPVIEPIYSGFVNSESAANLTAQPTCSTEATSASPLGSYLSTCSGAASSNYTITNLSGIVTVSYDLTTLGSDPTKYNKGVSVPLAIEIVNADGSNLSSSDTTITLASPAVSPDPSPGVQPTGAFSFDGNKYHYVLDTKDYPAGTYSLSYIISGDPTTHSITFIVY